MKFDPVRSGKMDPVVIRYLDGTDYLFSYERPLAAFIPDRGYVAVDEPELSVTNRARIEDWLRKRKASADQITYDEMVDLFAAHLRRLGE